VPKEFYVQGVLSIRLCSISATHTSLGTGSVCYNIPVVTPQKAWVASAFN